MGAPKGNKNAAGRHKMKGTRRKSYLDRKNFIERMKVVKKYNKALKERYIPKL